MDEKRTLQRYKASHHSPLHQWAKTYMGMPPKNGRMHEESESYGVINVDKIVSWEPIVQIGLRTWKPTSKFLEVPIPRCPPGGARKRKRTREREPKGVGEALFANNVHVWTCNEAEA